ncbi:unnamed protein product [Boreogadus saida]
MNEVEGLRLRRLNRPQVITDDLHMPQSKGSSSYSGKVLRLAGGRQAVPAHIMQNPDAAQRQQQLQGQAAAIQRDTTESFALLREAVLRLTQHAVRDSPTAPPRPASSLSSAQMTTWRHT